MMTVSTTGSRLGCNVFGIAVLACGLVTLTKGGSIFIYAIAAAQCIGGIAIQFDRAVKVGAAIIGAAYLVLSVLSVSQMVSSPQVYASWGNFFYPFAVVLGAAIVLARASHMWKAESVARTARILFGICALSFGVEQAEFLGRTASLVPKWIPPSQMFWAIATCAPFALAAVALFVNKFALLAIRLFTVMMLLFGVLVWIPILLSDPHNHGNWVEATETLAIAGAAWILADLLATLNSAVV